jgi:GrpB-like predicted nucleotidyltransferase (UPF0157 family)
MTETRYPALPPRLDVRLREVEAELEWRQREVEALRRVRDALARRESGACEAAEVRAGSSPWFEEILARVWTAF